MEQEILATLEALRIAVLLIKSQNRKIEELSASVFVNRSALAGILDQEAYKQVEAEEERYGLAAAWE